MIEPRKAETIARFLASRIAGINLPFAVSVDGSTRRDRQQLSIVNGVAVIDVTGVLVHRSGQMDAESTPLLSYEQLGLEVDAALRSSEVRGILLRIDSPGGEVNGVFDLADRIFAARKIKPIWAIAADYAASAAYLIASAAERVIVSKSAISGSIGVVLNRLDITKALEADGVRVIQIAHGARKLDGQPVQPWKEGSDEDKALRDHTLSYYDMFVNAVAQYRGLSADVVRKTDAAVYVGVEGVQAGLATKLGTIDTAINELRALATGRPLMSFTGDSNMKLEDLKAQHPELVAAVLADAPKLTREQMEAQYPDIVAAIRADAVKPVPPTAEQERARVLGIQALKGPEKLTAQAVKEGWSIEKTALEMRKAQLAGQEGRIDALREDDRAIGAIPASASAGEQVAAPSPALLAAKARKHKDEQAAQGINITTAEAVRHVWQSLGLAPTTPAGAEQ